MAVTSFKKELPVPLPPDEYGNPQYWAPDPTDPETQILHPDYEIGIDSQKEWHGRIVAAVQAGTPSLSREEVATHFTPAVIIAALGRGAFSSAVRAWTKKDRPKEEVDSQLKKGRRLARRTKVSHSCLYNIQNLPISNRKATIDEN
jgi:hypothetical protein